MTSEIGLARLPATETERLRVAGLDVADAREVRALTDDPAITDAISFLSSPFLPANAEELIRSGSGARDRFLGIRLRDGGALVGVFGVHLHGEDEIEIGYWVGVPHHGKGYATEATKGMVAALTKLFPDRRIIAECRPDNLASWAVLTKADFVATGEDGARSGRKRLMFAPISSP